MPHPKKKIRVMTYFIIKNIATGSYFVNKSTKPEVSVRHQFNRAMRPERADYNCKFYQDIRKYGVEGFEVEYSLEMPEWAICRSHYVVKLPDGSYVVEKRKDAGDEDDYLEQVIAGRARIVENVDD